MYEEDQVKNNKVSPIFKVLLPKGVGELEKAECAKAGTLFVSRIFPAAVS